MDKDIIINSDMGGLDIFSEFIDISDEKILVPIINKYSTKYGLNTSVPIQCHNKSCQYLSRCTIPPEKRKLNGYCLQEVATCIARFNALCNELEVKDDDIIDAGFVKDIVETELMIMRCENKFAESAAVMVKVWVAVDKACKDHYANEVHPLIQTKINLVNHKTKLLQLLNSTRKDKVQENKRKKDPTISHATTILNAINNIPTEAKIDIGTSNKKSDIFNNIQNNIKEEED